MEAYPMPLFIKLFVNNMESSLDWYKNVLQFESVFEMPDTNGKKLMAHIRGEKYQDLMLLSDTNQIDSTKKGKGLVLNFSVSDIDSFYKRAKEAQTNIIEGPVDRPWNARELVIEDPDGYTITLSMVIDKEKTFNEVMDS